MIDLDVAVLANALANAATAIAVAYTANTLRKVLLELRGAARLERDRHAYYEEDSPRED